MISQHAIWMIIVHFICCSIAQNTWIGDSVSWWQSTSDFNPTHSAAYGTLQLRDAMYMEFDIVNNGPTPTSWQNVFRLGFASGNGDCANHYSRYPSLWMMPNVNKWHFSVSEGYECGKQWGLQPTATQGLNYHMIVHYNDSLIYISYNNIEYLYTTRSPTIAELKGRTMYVFMSTDETGASEPIPAANVTLSNIIIVSYWYNQGFTLPPTTTPTQMPTTTPTTHPTSAPTIPTTTPTVTPSMNPSTNPSTTPTNNPTNTPSTVPTTTPSLSPTFNPSTTPSETPSTQPSLYPSANPSNTPTHIPSNAPINPTESPIFSRTRAALETDNVDPALTIIIENLIYIGIALIACFAICCPALFVWVCCYAQICIVEKESEDGEHSSDNSDKHKHSSDKPKPKPKPRESMSSWTIPIKRNKNAKKKRKKKGTQDENVVPVSPADNMEFEEGNIDGDTDNEDFSLYTSEDSTEEQRMERQRQKDEEIRAEQMRAHQQRFLPKQETEMCKVDTTSESKEMSHTNTDHFRNCSDLLDNNEIIMAENAAKTEREMSGQRRVEIGNKGMGVNRMNLEDALDDGLSIVPSIGKYSVSQTKSEEPIPHSHISPTHKPYTVTIDEEKEIEVYERGKLSLQRESNDSPNEVDTEETETYESNASEESRQKQIRNRRVNRNGNPFIPKRELETYYIDENQSYDDFKDNNSSEYGGDNVYNAYGDNDGNTEENDVYNEYNNNGNELRMYSNGDSNDYSSGYTDQYSNEFYEEHDNDDIIDIHYSLQKHMTKHNKRLSKNYDIHKKQNKPGKHTFRNYTE